MSMVERNICPQNEEPIYTILLIFLTVVEFEIVSITAKPYILQKIYLSDFVQNSFHCNMVIIMSDLKGDGGC